MMEQTFAAVVRKHASNAKHSLRLIHLGGIAMGQTRHLILTNLGSSQRRVVVVGLVDQELEEPEMAGE